MNDSIIFDPPQFNAHAKRSLSLRILRRFLILAPSINKYSLKTISIIFSQAASISALFAFNKTKSYNVDNGAKRSEDNKRQQKTLENY